MSIIFTFLMTIHSISQRDTSSLLYKLREVLSDIEMKGSISKPIRDYASPLVIVWKKSGDTGICTDFRWLNAKTVKDAHPLPHQANCLDLMDADGCTLPIQSEYHSFTW